MKLLGYLVSIAVLGLLATQEVGAKDASAEQIESTELQNEDSDVASVVSPEPADSKGVLVETFIPPVIEKVKNPVFPRRNQRRGREGWVAMNFMVDPEGQPYDIVVTSSSGDDLFEKAAVKATEKWQFSPAILDGDAIDAGVQYMITFQLSNFKGAQRRFGNIYRKFNKSIETNGLELAQSHFEEMQNLEHNLYEGAYFALADYRLRFAQGASPGQLYAALRQATFMDRGRGYLPEQTLTSVLIQQANLEIKLGKFAAAKETAKKLMNRDIDADRREKIGRLLASVEELRIGTGSFSTNGVIRKDNRFFKKLLTSSFRVTDIVGDIAEVRLHCDKGYRGFVLQEDLQYTVSDEWTDCGINLIGNPGTTFRLVEEAGAAPAVHNLEDSTASE